MISTPFIFLLSASLFFEQNVVHSFSLPKRQVRVIVPSVLVESSTSTHHSTRLLAHDQRQDEGEESAAAAAGGGGEKENKLQRQIMERRSLFSKTGKLLTSTAASVAVVGATAPATPANAMNNKSRNDGYAVQYTDREWAYLLSGRQYNILRQGGTERQNSSILEGEEREGTYKCAGCATPLFASSAKFHSGTGWPSYAGGLPGAVEVEDVNPVQASLLGAEIRCGTCGGHLGDIFNDGFLYVNTPAFVTGKRLCVDGAALIFKPADGSDDVFGDLPPPPKKKELPDFLSPPKIVPQGV